LVNQLRAPPGRALMAAMSQRRFANLHVLVHPLVTDRLGRLRDRATPMAEVRAAVRALGRIMAPLALEGLPTQTVPIETPLERTIGHRLDPPPVVVPILRAGLAFAEGILDVMPDAAVGHIGLKRDETTHLPAEYLVRLPPLAGRDVILADPMIATGHSSVHALDVLIEAGAAAERIRFIGIVAAPEGIALLAERHPTVPVTVAALDDGLDADAFILPGIGDCGDRLYGTE
jgi:uracil phosphoribosyltransferase